MIATAIRNHTQLLNYLVEKYNLKSYLEIGVQNPANNFYKIKAEIKFGVDPEIQPKVDLANCTSDEFFEKIMPLMIEKHGREQFIDICFIDGLHHADQVKRDFENSLRCLNDGGFIVLHDTLPEDEEGSLVPRQTKQWWGDVYKFAFKLNEYDGIKFKTVNMDCGCTVVWKDKSETAVRKLGDIDWNYYQTYKHLLHIIQPEEIEKYF